MHQISNFHRVFMYFNNEKITITCKELLTIDLNTKAKNLNIYITTTFI